MSRIVNIFSKTLSLLMVFVALGLLAVTLYLDGEATWDGGNAPPTWRTAAAEGDIFRVSGYDIAYWGDPTGVYSRYATRSKRLPVAIVVHHTAVKPVKSLVQYGHVNDANRGGAFGYHFYVGRDGSIVQGAPLSRRTNHIKFMNHQKRTSVGRHLWSGNTIGVSLVGGCDPIMRPASLTLSDCSDEFITQAQLKAGLDVIRSLQAHFAMACEEVYGHGDLQVDRQNFEGLRLSRLARVVCTAEEEEAAMHLPPAPLPAPDADSAMAAGAADSAMAAGAADSAMAAGAADSAMAAGAADSAMAAGAADSAMAASAAESAKEAKATVTPAKAFKADDS
ncbi:MAG: N-acetylmuramoyl-L-alanine amidase [Alphaproteobacteria bacterium]|nr:N-acetylmuramoyl-L-alanine amidase [Alphaproteobacteria bacterium]